MDEPFLSKYSATAAPRVVPAHSSGVHRSRTATAAQPPKVHVLP